MTNTVGILLANDSQKLRALYRMALEAEGGFEVIAEASDGAEAISLARAHLPPIVLLDLSRPTLDGLESLGGIRTASPERHVVVLTGFGRGRLGEIARELGASDLTEKGIARPRSRRACGRSCDTPRPPFPLMRTCHAKRSSSEHANSCKTRWPDPQPCAIR